MGRVGYAGKLLKSFWQFSKEYKAYWIVPLVLILGLVALLIFTSQTAAPSIYTLF